MKRFVKAIAIVAFALAGAAGAGAQGAAPQERINTTLARARQVGIPVSLLENKMAEGKAKGVPLERVAVAIERRLAALERASQVLRGEPDAAASLGVTADAIESGVGEVVLKSVAANLPRDRRNVAIATLTELVHQGHAPEAALGRVKNALKAGPDALTNLPGESAGRGRGNGPPDGQKQGNARGQGGGAETGTGPPSAVPAPGKPPQSGQPEGRGRGRPSDPGQPGDPGRPDNPGRGNNR